MFRTETTRSAHQLMQLLRYCICMSRVGSKEIVDRETAQREHARGVQLYTCGAVASWGRPGPKLYDGLRRYAKVLAEERGLTVEELEAGVRQQIEEEGVAPRYDGPSAAQVQAYLRWSRARDGVLNCGVAVYNALLGWAGVSRSDSGNAGACS